VTALLGETAPAERHATCSDCAMCAKDGTFPGDTSFYSPVTKCCTFLPELANFLVGGVLGDPDPGAIEGRATVEARIAARVGVTPLGLGRSKVYSLLYGHSRRGFGRAKALECPHHLPDGRCGVWRHRESTCATWFCKHERGQVSKDFWNRLHDLLTVVEIALSRHAVLSLGLPASSLEKLFPPRAVAADPTLDADLLDGHVDPRAYAAAWGTWVGREAEFYRRSAELAAKLSWDDVLAIGGMDVALCARLAREAHARLSSNELPERIRHRRLRVVSITGDTARIETYSAIDPLAIPKKLFDVLHRFDGRTTAETVTTIENDHGLRLSPGLVRKLIDFDVLGEDG
jgi:hypothetical protein